ncbi:MAG: polymorphic toxin-type HINT domain-containing protein [Candidatus Magasanikbacteria bacterium]
MFRRKAKQFVDFLEHKDASSCNDEELSSLLRVADDIEKSANLNSQMQPRPGFEEQLKQKVLASRQHKPEHMKNPFSGVREWFGSLFTMKTWIPVGITSLIVLILLSSMYLWPGMQNGPSQGSLFSGFSKLVISPAFAEDNFELRAVKADSLGVETNSSYILTSKEALETSVIKDHITIEPKVDYEIKQLSSTEWEIIPDKPIEPNTIVKVALATSYTDDTGTQKERDYSWAFQVKDTFKVLNTIPRDKAASVPINSGIEVTFSHDNFENFEKFVSISPAVAGSFEKHGRTLVFVPHSSLPRQTIYTVTIKQGLPLSKSGDVLPDDYIFSFETEGQSKYDYNNYFNVGDKFQEFSSVEKALVQVFSSGDEAQNVDTRVYKFRSEQDFIQTMKDMDAFPYWSSSRDDYRVDTKNLQEVMNFSGEVKSENYVRYVEFPDTLPKGFYVADFSSGKEIAQAYIQVSDLITYLNASRTDTIVWVNDLKTKLPAGGATISFLDTNLSYSTNGQGIATFKTPNFFKPEEDEGSVYVRIGRESDALILNAYEFMSQDISAKTASDYWKYVYTDRPMYQTNDTIKFWGLAKDRIENRINEKVTISLYKEGYIDYYYRPVHIAEQELQISDLGTFSGNFELKNVKPDYYTLELRVGDIIVAHQYITVESYVKPAYNITLEKSTSAAYVGDIVKFKAKAAFFEGTPVPELNMVATIQNREIPLVTNDAGEAEFTYTEKYEACDSSYGNCWPKYRYISVRPRDSELSEITAQASVRFFGPRVYLDNTITYPEPGVAQIELNTKKIDLNSATSDEWWHRSLGNENAPGTRVVGEVRKTTYVKVETGTKYDFINKQRYTTYYYESKVEVVDTFDVATDNNGSYIYRLNVVPETSYDITFKTYDAQGLYDVEKSYAYYYNGQRFFRNYYGNENYSYYFLERVEEKKMGYAVGEVAHMRFMRNDDVSPDGDNKYLFLQMQNGLQEYSIGSRGEYTVQFEQRDIPNVNIVGVYFTGTTYKSVETGMYGSPVAYDSSSKNLKINISTDKQMYTPGQEVKLDVLVTDKNDNPIESEVNLNLVDEAFYALQDDVASPLEKIYGGIDSGTLFSMQTHYSIVDVYGGAEMGGCFVEGTMIRMFDGSQKPIEQITKGDSISTFESPARQRLASGTVSEVFAHVVPFYIRINGILGVTPIHVVYSNGQFVEAGKLKVGDWLLNAQGEKVVIESLESVNGFVNVYNFRVDPQHTYFANDFYVHNEKGGGPREFFTDAALFQVVRTNGSGRAEVTFTLPDNITSWRVTAQALTQDLHVGANTAKIPVSLPVFAEIGVGKEYLKTDKPEVKLRAYGTSLSSKDDVEFSVEAKSLGVEKSDILTSKAFASTYYPLPPLTLGTHDIVYNVKTTKGKDAIKLPLNVIDSRLEARVAKEEKLTINTVIIAENDKPVTVVLSDRGQNVLYGPLLDLSWMWGDRVDQVLPRQQAKLLLRDYYNETIFEENTNASMYQLPSGGISLLPYSSEDLELSARIAGLKTDVFDNEALRQFFFQKLEDKKSNREEVSLALYGLAQLGEPVLARIQVWLERTDLSAMEKLYIAQALYDIGDAEKARDMYVSLLEEFGQQKDPYIILRINDKPEDVFKATIRAAVLASSLQRSEAFGLWNYVIDNQMLSGEEKNSEQLYTIEKLSFIAHMLPQLKPSPSEVTFTLFGEEQTIKLTGGATYDIQLDPAHVNELKFKSVVGEVGISTIYTKPLVLQNVSKDLSVGIARRYFVNGQETRNFKEQDTIEVRLYPQFSKNAMIGTYQLTDILPLGLVPITKVYTRDLEQKNSLCTYYPYNINGPVVKFTIDKYWNSYSKCSFIRYYARVKTPGQYTSEPAIIQSMINPEYLNYSPQENVVITH